MLEDVGKDGREDSGGSRGEEEEAEQEEDTVSGDTRTKRDSNYEPAASVMEDQGEKCPQEHKTECEQKLCQSRGTRETLGTRKVEIPLRLENTG